MGDGLILPGQVGKREISWQKRESAGRKETGDTRYDSQRIKVDRTRVGSRGESSEAKVTSSNERQEGSQ
jgi:hypothetical protein